MAAVTAIGSMGACAHNPRGNLWYYDQNTIGRKLLKKYNWSDGKGLGKNEDGIKENLSVKFRDSKSGLGYKDDPFANVVNMEYESILKNLSACYSKDEACSDQINDPKNRQKSRIIKSKVRYARQLIGRDVSKYSEEENKSIFIFNQLQTNDNQKFEAPAPALNQKSVEELPKGQTYSSTLSISDYFALKMQEKKNKLNQEPSSQTNQQQPLDSKVCFLDTSSAKSTVSSRNEAERNAKQNLTNDLNVQPLMSKICGTVENIFTKGAKRKSSEDNDDRIESLPSGLEHECAVPKKKKQKITDDSFCEKSIYEVEKKSKSSKNSKNKPDADLEPKKKHKKHRDKEKKTKKDSICDDNTICLTKKKKYLNKLKSCLRTKSGKYNIKNVSFNETVSYQIIASDNESDCAVVSHTNTNGMEFSNKAVDAGVQNENGSTDETSATQESSLEKCNDDSIVEVRQTDLDDDLKKSTLLSNLPSPKSPYYNYWVETQRQALKMKMYRNIYKNIKKDIVLKSSNLFHIKGYGNWGFK